MFFPKAVRVFLSPGLATVPPPKLKYTMPGGSQKNPGILLPGNPDKLGRIAIKEGREGCVVELDRFGDISHSPELQFPRRAQPLFPFPKCSQGRYCNVLTATEDLLRNRTKASSPQEEVGSHRLCLFSCLGQELKCPDKLLGP